MEQNFKDLTQNKNSKIDIEGTVIKIEMKPQLTQIQKMPNGNLGNQEEHFDEIKNENQSYDQNKDPNTLSVEETIDVKLENEEIRSYICGKRLNSEENEG